VGMWAISAKYATRGSAPGANLPAPPVRGGVRVATSSSCLISGAFLVGRSLEPGSDTGHVGSVPAARPSFLDACRYAPRGIRIGWPPGAKQWAPGPAPHAPPLERRTGWKKVSPRPSGHAGVPRGSALGPPASRAGRGRLPADARPPPGRVHARVSVHA